MTSCQYGLQNISIATPLYMCLLTVIKYVDERAIKLSKLFVYLILSRVMMRNEVSPRKLLLKLRNYAGSLFLILLVYLEYYIPGCSKMFLQFYGRHYNPTA